MSKSLLENAVEQFPEELPALQALCRFLYEREFLAEAAVALERLTVWLPEDAATLHNLGMVYFRSGNRDAAIDAFQRSLELRPDAHLTREQLALALRGIGG